MRTDDAPSTVESAEEVSALIATLHETSHRLETLTAGEVDTVADRQGRTYLLRHVQEQLRHSEAARQAAILNALPAHIALLDSQGLIVSVNQAWRRFAGDNALQPPGDAVGLDYLAVCDGASGDHCSEAQHAAAGIRSVLDGSAKEFSLEYPCHSPSEQRWFLLTATPLDEGRPKGAVVMHVNVTERKHSEAARRQSEARYRTLFDYAPDGIVIVNDKGYYVDANASMCRMLGYTREEFVRLHSSDVATPEELSYIEPALLALKTTADYHREWQLRRKDGSVFPAEVIGTAMPDGNLLAMVRDITERKRAEAALQKTQQDLIRSSRQAGMAEVATSVLHNVGNVLNSVNVSASIVMDSAKSSRAGSMAKVATLLLEHGSDLGSFITNDPKGKHIPAFLHQISLDWLAQQKTLIRELESLRGNIDHIKGIVAMQQTHAKVSGTSELVSLGNLVEDSLRMEQDALRRHGVQVIRDFEPVPPISTDKHRILQILVNLVRNAKYACDDSGGAGKLVTVRIATVDGRIRITVSDNGVGIVPENLTRIFSHGFTTRKDGHGFGLHSSAIAATELGGKLTAHSDGRGKGATFTLELPLAGPGPP